MGLLPLLHHALRGGSRRPRCRLGRIVGVDLSARRSRRHRQGFAECDGHAQWRALWRRAPATEPDPALWPLADFDVLVQSFKAHGFRPSCAWYLNDDANIAYARKAPSGGRLSQPVLFVNGDFDQICSIIGNRQGDPMRAACPDLTVTSMPAGHWLPLERKAEHIEAIRTWLQSKKL